MSLLHRAKQRSEEMGFKLDFTGAIATNGKIEKWVRDIYDATAVEETFRNTGEKQYIAYMPPLDGVKIDAEFIVVLYHEMGHIYDWITKGISPRDYYDNGMELECEEHAWTNAAKMLVQDGFTEWDVFEQLLEMAYTSYAAHYFENPQRHVDRLRRTTAAFYKEG